MQENRSENVVKGARSTFWIMFFFMLLHQADKLLIGPLTTQIMDSFKISYTQMGAVTTGALIVGAIFYPLWGSVSYTHFRAHETVLDLVCRLLLEKNNVLPRPTASAANFSFFSTVSSPATADYTATLIRIL